MSGQGGNQSPSSQLAEIQSQLECPVCFNIPRELPIPSSPSGHIVCRPCKTKVKNCPTCRKPMPEGMINSVVGGLIEKVEHNCKYSDQGCEFKMMLKDLGTHEKECPDRTIACPWHGCGHQVKLNSFESHATEHTYTAAGGRALTWKILKNDVSCFGHNESSMGGIKALDELFFVNLSYHKPSECFVFSIWLAKGQDVASKYIANLVIEGDNNKLCYEGIQVSSVENVPTIDKLVKDVGNISLCLPKNLARNISVKRQKMGEGECLSVEFSFKKI